MSTIDIEVKIDSKVGVTVHIADVIQGINEQPMKKRWSSIAQIIDEVEVDILHMTDEQKKIIKNYLTEKLSLF